MFGENKENKDSGLQKQENKGDTEQFLNAKFKNPFMLSVKKLELKPIADPTLETLGEKSLSIDAYQLSNASKELFDLLNKPNA